MTSGNDVPQVSVQELKRRLDAGTPPVILDVREAHEVQIAQIPQHARSLHIPLGQLQQRVVELESYKGEEIIVYCRSGGRSQVAAQFLGQHGHRAANLAGGVLAWSREIDPSVPQY